MSGGNYSKLMGLGTSLPQEKTENSSSVQVNERSNEQLNNRTNEQIPNRSDERTNERSIVQDFRRTTRASFDVYEDQLDLIDEWVLKQKKQQKRRVTKGELMREIIDFYFAKKR